MHIAILGAGNVGGTLTRHWSGQGHAVILGVRDPAAHAALIAETGARAAPLGKAAAGAEVIVLALPWSEAEGARAGLGDLSGKIVIDAMNPIARTTMGPALAIGHTTSGGEMVAGWLPGARVVKTLNQCGAEIMADNRAMAHRPLMFMAGDDADAKLTVAMLLQDLGFDPLDAGDLTKARLLEPLAMVWINQAILRGKGRDWAFAAVSNPKGWTMTDMLTGRCHCGNIHFTLPQSAAGVLACHCEDCRKMHVNNNAFLAAPIADVSLTGDLIWYQSSATARRAFCGTCGARVLKEVAAAGRWLMSAGLIDGATGKHIIKNLGEGSKGDWYALPEVGP